MHILHKITFSDYFFESMILLKMAFCWDWKDVLYFVTNQRAEREELHGDLAKRMMKWNHIDAAIFQKAFQFEILLKVHIVHKF